MRRALVIVSALAIIPWIAGVGVARAGCASASRGAGRVEVESILDDVAMAHSIDPALLAAIARVESGECADAVSPKGAAGLMQLMPETASEYGVDDRFDPVQNALGAARFIDYLRRDRARGRLSLPEILAAYNAGEAAVQRAGGIPHYRETEEYVRRVLWIYLIGHVPESERMRTAALDADSPPREIPKRSSVHPAHVAEKRRIADSDTTVLERLSELKRARESEISAVAPVSGQ
jgi:hypothetical protein